MNSNRLNMMSCPQPALAGLLLHVVMQAGKELRFTEQEIKETSKAMGSPGENMFTFEKLEDETVVLRIEPAPEQPTAEELKELIASLEEEPKQ